MSHAYAISEVSARSPDMSDREFAEFVEDIRANGQLVPIWVRGDEVIDGRKRLAACERLGIEPKVVNLDPSQDADRIAHALNVLRTHYAPSQRAIFGAMRANARGGGDRPLRKNTESKEITVNQAAREVGVSQSYISKARQVMGSGAPEVVEAVKAGALTLHAARNIVLTVPKDEQPRAVEKVVHASRGLARQTPVSRALEQQDVRRDRAFPNPKHEQFALAVQKLEVGAELITQHVAAASQDVRRNDFLNSLREVRTAISRAINALEAA